jgi:glycosyltransferase involved in cell wall biosynthesis
MRGRAVLVSVIVPTRNAARTLPQQLDAIAEQDYADRFEIIIAMNGGRDGTADVAPANAAKQPEVSPTRRAAVSFDPNVVEFPNKSIAMVTIP